ncbi:flavorubredoxin oxidoreductase [uncultured Spirochaetota bacterium]|jgi:flavorubredoxin|uniref:Flavorubredoxin oxidoreductase n=1 Tax=uncultured Spirochaetota bacterium TaxID=460511 RepID=A0A652ZTP4_9SPIR|nr:flavorubredoxin oxidoreductase [uncultured Spirochaetota bacterium]
MKKHLKGNVYWVGKIDWELKKFHGEEYSTHKGSSYNSYVIQEEKTVLVDTVWLPFAKEFVDNLEAEGILDKLDAVVQNHGEVDHSGALPELLRRRPGLPVYCTANAVKSLKGQYHEDWNFHVVKTGDSLDLGKGKKLVFVEARMLHWPDSMFSYLAGEAILFSNDAFGQHYASELLFNDLVDQDELYDECIKYYANILTPFSPLVTAKINEVVGMNLPVDMIATSHGVIWRNDPLQIVTKYAEWAKDYKEDRITIIYDSMWGGTRKLAESIAKGIAEASPSTDVRLHNVGKSDKNDAITDIFRSRAVLVGSPTIGQGILSAVAGILEEIKGLKFKGKKAGVFGCYGWSGEGNKVLAENLKAGGFELVGEGLKNQWNPDDAGYAAAVEYGKLVAKA